MKISIHVDGVQSTVRAFDTVGDGIKDFRKTLQTWTKVRQAFYRVIKEIFANEGGKSKWAALSVPYAAIKAKRWGNKPILQASGAMYKSLSQSGAAGSFVDVQALEMTIGTTDPKAGWHHRGAGRLPARSIDFTDEHEKQIFAPIGLSCRQLAQNARLADSRVI